MLSVIALLSVQALLGAFDNLYHHELVARLPQSRAARKELALHTLREFLYALLFLGLAWRQWHGVWAALVAAALIAEVGLTLADFVVEDMTRRLPGSERVLHGVLAINFGALLALLTPVLLGWAAEPTALVAVDYGPGSWLLSVYALGVGLWAVRDSVATLRGYRPPLWQRDPFRIGHSDTPRTILVAGATGFIGRAVTRRFIADGEYVIVLARDPAKAEDLFGPQVRIFTDPGQIAATTRIDVIVNLAGAPILALPWTRPRRVTLLASRVAVTAGLVALCRRLNRRPAVLVNASAVGYYGVRDDALLDEHAEPQERFQSELCRRWEAAAHEADGLGVRVVCLRIGLVLGRGGGALPALCRPLRLGLGAQLGSGRQWLSWIHERDLVRLIRFVIDRDDLAGAVNAAAPRPVRHREFMRALGVRLRRPVVLRLPAWLLRLGLGERAELLVDGQRVVPARARAAGFEFDCPDITAALADLYPGRAADDNAPLEVYYNGACPGCRRELEHYQRIAARIAGRLTGRGPGRPPAALSFVDVSSRERVLARWGLGFAQAERRLYARQGARMLSGIDAFLALWRRLPGHRWLARLVALPGVHGLCVVVYEELLAPGLVRWNHRRLRRPVTAGRAPDVRAG